MIIREHRQIEPLEKPLDRTALSTAQAAILSVAGMDCSYCMIRLRNELLSLDGVLIANIFLASGVAIVAFAPEHVNPASLITAVTNAGNDGRYRARLLDVMPSEVAF